MTEDGVERLAVMLRILQFQEAIGPTDIRRVIEAGEERSQVFPGYPRIVTFCPLPRWVGPWREKAFRYPDTVSEIEGLRCS